MNGMQNLLVMGVMGTYLLISIPVGALAIAWLTHPYPTMRQHRRSVALVMLFVTIGIGGVMIHVLQTAPAFDFIERCRPAGTGTCLDGQSYTAVAQTIQADIWRTAWNYLILPLALGATLGSRILRRQG